MIKYFFSEKLIQETHPRNSQWSIGWFVQVIADKNYARGEQVYADLLPDMP